MTDKEKEKCWKKMFYPRALWMDPNAGRKYIFHEKIIETSNNRWK